MTVLHTGATKKYSENWGAIFSGRKAAAGATKKTTANVKKKAKKSKKGKK